MQITEEQLKEAAALFHQPPAMYNCSQSVCAICGRNDLCTDEMKAKGGGRAPEGISGALYAAMQLVPEEKWSAMRKGFAAMAGAETCQAIKSEAKTPCQMCVAIGAALVKKYTTLSNS